MHEVNMDISQMNAKIDDMIKDYNKRITNCALQKDFAFI